MTGTRKETEKNKVMTQEQLQKVSEEINTESEDFLGEAKPEKLEVEDDLQLDRVKPAKSLSQVAKQTVLSDDKSVFDILEAAENAGENSGSVVGDAEYWQPVEGEVLNVIVTGFITTTIKKKEVKCVCFKNKKNELFIAGATTLVKAIEKIETELPAVIRIIVKEKVSGDNGNYFTFDIFRL